MTTTQLINKLKNFPPDTDVCVFSAHDCFCNVTDVKKNVDEEGVPIVQICYDAPTYVKS